MRDGRQAMIEYSDLPDDLAERRAADGGSSSPRGRSPSTSSTSRSSARLAAGGGRLPFHRALKPVPYVDEHGSRVEPDVANAVKFEQFIFDALPLAERALVVETDRETRVRAAQERRRRRPRPRRCGPG